MNLCTMCPSYSTSWANQDIIRGGTLELEMGYTAE